MMLIVARVAISNCNQPNTSKFLTDELMMNDDDDVVENWKMSWRLTADSGPAVSRAVSQDTAVSLVVGAKPANRRQTRSLRHNTTYLRFCYDDNNVGPTYVKACRLTIYHFATFTGGSMAGNGC